MSAESDGVGWQAVNSGKSYSLNLKIVCRQHSFLLRGGQPLF